MEIKVVETQREAAYGLYILSGVSALLGAIDY
jgi:hypothetical protein